MKMLIPGFSLLGDAPLANRVLRRVAILSSCLAATLLASCAGSASKTSQPAPGSGISEFRQLTQEARKSVGTVLDRLEALDRSGSRTNSAAAISSLDDAMRNLDLTSLRTRSRAEAIIARGHAYFAEWDKQLAALGDTAQARSDKERYTRLREHFDRVLDRSGAVRGEFRPFMARLREFRAALDPAPFPGQKAPAAGDLDALTQSARRVQVALGSVSEALDQADIALRATLASKQ